MFFNTGFYTDFDFFVSCANCRIDRSSGDARFGYLFVPDKAGSNGGELLFCLRKIFGPLPPQYPVDGFECSLI